MAKNKTPGDKPRSGPPKTRSQIKNPVTGTWTKRELFMKANPKPFKGVRRTQR